MAIESLERAVGDMASPIYVYHEIVHNRHVVDHFRSQGVTFVDDVGTVPEGAILFYSAHGVAPAVRELSKTRRLRTIDATCPLVSKVHREAIRFAREGYHIVLIGHAGHDEVVGTMGEVPDHTTLVTCVDDVDRLPFTPDDPLAYLMQTTLSVDESAVIIERLRQRFPGIVAPPKQDICYATTNRQEAVKALVGEADVLLVLGSQHSSNSVRLMEIGLSAGLPSHLIDGTEQLRSMPFAGTETLVITAGASTPEAIVQTCIDHLRERYHAMVEIRTMREENVHFQLPREEWQMDIASS